MSQYIGEIACFAFSVIPSGWLPCDGRLLQIASNTALYSLLGTTYGGDGMTTFAIPDLRGRFPNGWNTLGYPNSTLGNHGGADAVALTVDQLPAHSHTARASSAQANKRDPGGNTWAQEAMGQDAVYGSQAANVDMAAGAIANSGGGQAHPNMPPYLVVTFCIATAGPYPSP